MFCFFKFGMFSCQKNGKIKFSSLQIFYSCVVSVVAPQLQNSRQEMAAALEFDIQAFWKSYQCIVLLHSVSSKNMGIKIPHRHRLPPAIVITSKPAPISSSPFASRPSWAVLSLYASEYSTPEPHSPSFLKQNPDRPFFSLNSYIPFIFPPYYSGESCISPQTSANKGLIALLYLTPYSRILSFDLSLSWVDLHNGIKPFQSTVHIRIRPTTARNSSIQKYLK